MSQDRRRTHIWDRQPPVFHLWPRSLPTAAPAANRAAGYIRQLRSSPQTGARRHRAARPAWHVPRLLSRARIFTRQQTPWLHPVGIMRWDASAPQLASIRLPSSASMRHWQGKERTSYPARARLWPRSGRHALRQSHAPGTGQAQPRRSCAAASCRPGRSGQRSAPIRWAGYQRPGRPQTAQPGRSLCVPPCAPATRNVPPATAGAPPPAAASRRSGSRHRRANT